MRPSTHPRPSSHRSIPNAAAEILGTGRADKEIYLLENVALGVDFVSAGSFDGVALSR
jgi:hypothetical protein